MDGVVMMFYFTRNSLLAHGKKKDKI